MSPAETQLQATSNARGGGSVQDPCSPALFSDPLMDTAFGSSGAGPDVLLQVFPGSSELARLCRERDWARTPLGPVEQWPQSLRTTVSTLLSAPFAMMLAWGPELVQVYNDGYRDMIGAKHPAALGQRASECWSEIWDEIGPLFEQVRRSEAVWMDDMPLTINRHGAAEQTCFTFAYSPVRDEAGGVGGVLDVAFETTSQVAARLHQEERERLHLALELERSRLSSVFRQASSFLAVQRGPEHVYEWVNDAYHQLVGDRDLLGKPVREALPEVVHQGFTDLLDGVLTTGEPFIGREMPVVLARVPGAPQEERFVDFVYTPLTEADGTRSGIVTHGYDVTEQVLARRQVERLLKESERERMDAEAARQEAESANRSKTEFLSAMSHELRTPLNAIGGYAELLEMGIHGPVTAAQHTALRRIVASQHHLLALIQDILSYARLEAGRLEFYPRPLRVSHLLAGVEPLLLPQAQAKGIALAIEPCDPDLGLVADEERIRQILLNLAGNAVKFTGPGGWIALACDADDHWARFRVRDNGCGIAKEDQGRIFDVFRQVGRRLNDPQEGVGLGLAISRDLATAMGGDLSVESTPGVGSTFTLRLPRDGGKSGPEP